MHDTITHGDYSMAQRVGLFGGTFDPIHIGHLILLEEARYALGLNMVYLMPAADPPHKQGRRISSVPDRFRMCDLATLDADYIHISRIDADRPGPHYSADMIPLLREEIGDDASIFFLMGLDSLRDLPTWHEPERLLAQCTVVALSRAEVEIDWQKLEAALPGIRDQILIVDMPELEISSSDLRERVRSGRPIRYQTPLLVEEYIYSRRLYL